MKVMKLMLVAMMLVASLGVFAQAKKPTLMVMPSDAWCNHTSLPTTRWAVL